MRQNNNDGGMDFRWLDGKTERKREGEFHEESEKSDAGKWDLCHLI